MELSVAVEVFLADDKSPDQNPSRLPLDNLTLKEEIISCLLLHDRSEANWRSIHPRMAN